VSEFENRIGAVRERFPEMCVDALFVTHPTNRRYLTGFSADDIAPNESAGHLFVTPDRTVMITGSVNMTQAEAQAPHVEIRRRSRDWIVEDAAFIHESGIRRIGYEPMAMLEGVFSGISENLLESGHRFEWIPADDVVVKLRAVKSHWEIERIRKAFEITAGAFNAVAPTIEAGQTEREVAWKLHAAMIELGADEPAFPIIVAAGRNASRPHHEPIETIIQDGQPIIIDMGARFDGYCADLTRTVWVGEPDERLAEVYRIVAAAVEAVFERLQPGLDGSELDRFARDTIERTSYGEYFSHGLGHGVGMRVHEAPSASKTSTDIMTVGNTITIEPGIYLPEWGGVRIEDVVLFTEDGFDVLSSSAAKLHID
jgi:Xaa-Pro aminopeptidase